MPAGQGRDAAGARRLTHFGKKPGQGPASPTHVTQTHYACYAYANQNFIPTPKVTRFSLESIDWVPNPVVKSCEPKSV